MSKHLSKVLVLAFFFLRAGVAHAVVPFTCNAENNNVILTFFGDEDGQYNGALSGGTAQGESFQVVANEVDRKTSYFMNSVRADGRRDYDYVVRSVSGSWFKLRGIRTGESDDATWSGTIKIRIAGKRVTQVYKLDSCQL